MKHSFLLSALLCSATFLAANEPRDVWKADEYHQNSSSQKNAASDLIKYVVVKPDGKILDVGCGDGKITAELAALAPQGSLVGVDISPSMIAFATETFPAERFPNLRFVLKDAQKLDYNQEFDVVFSFTTQQWVQDHAAFLKGAHESLKPAGTLAVTMPTGLPSALERAVNEIISAPEWASYFTSFQTGWNFVSAKEYSALLSEHHFSTVRLSLVPQLDIFPSRAVFEKFISQWFPYLRPLPDELKKSFMTQVLDRYLALESPFPNGEVHFKIQRLEVVALKK